MRGDRRWIDSPKSFGVDSQVFRVPNPETTPTMSILKSIAALALILPLLASTARAGTTSCPNHFVNGQSPDFINQKLTEKAREVCYSDFALKHSGVTRTPLYSAEHLTRERLAMAKQIRRSSTFYPDPYIPLSERAELRHYARSGYSRGHVQNTAYNIL